MRIIAGKFKGINLYGPKDKKIRPLKDMVRENIFNFLISILHASSANFFLLNFDNCKFSAKYVFRKLELKGIILRSTEEGYNIKNKLRLTIGSKKENTKFISVMKDIFNK